MTDRNAGYIVTLDREIREDEDDAIRTALLMVKGVVDVSPVPASVDYHMALSAVRHDLIRKMYAAVDEVFDAGR